MTSRRFPIPQGSGDLFCKDGASVTGFEATTILALGVAPTQHEHFAPWTQQASPPDREPNAWIGFAPSEGGLSSSPCDATVSITRTGTVYAPVDS